MGGGDEVRSVVDVIGGKWEGAMGMGQVEGVGVQPFTGIEPYARGLLEVGDGNQIYWEGQWESGR